MDYTIMTDEEIMRDLAGRFDRLRIAHGVKESEIEQRSGVSRKTLYNFKQGKTGLSLRNLIRLLRVIDELDRLHSLFPEETPYHPGGVDPLSGKKRVRDKGAAVQDFRWGDEQ